MKKQRLIIAFLFCAFLAKAQKRNSLLHNDTRIGNYPLILPPSTDTVEAKILVSHLKDRMPQVVSGYVVKGNSNVLYYDVNIGMYQSVLTVIDTLYSNKQPVSQFSKQYIIWGVHY